MMLILLFIDRICRMVETFSCYVPLPVFVISQYYCSIIDIYGSNFHRYQSDEGTSQQPSGML